MSTVVDDNGEQCGEKTGTSLQYDAPKINNS